MNLWMLKFPLFKAKRLDWGNSICWGRRCDVSGKRTSGGIVFSTFNSISLLLHFQSERYLVPSLGKNVKKASQTSGVFPPLMRSYLNPSVVSVSQDLWNTWNFEEIWRADQPPEQHEQNVYGADFTHDSYSKIKKIEQLLRGRLSWSV